LVVIISSSFIKFFVTWFNANLVRSISVDISAIYLNKTFSKNYQFLTSSNSSTYFTNIIVKIDRVIEFLFKSLDFVTLIFVFCAIVISLLLIDIQITSLILLIFLSVYALLIFFIRKRTRKISHIYSINSELKVKSVLEALSYIRQILLSHSQDFYINKYKKIDSVMRKQQANTVIYQSFPKFFFEAFGILVISCVAFVLLKFLSYEKNNIVSILAVVAFGAQKLLFISNNIYGTWVSLATLKDSALDISNFLNEKSNLNIKRKIDNQPFKKIQFKNVSFKYNNDKNYIFKNINFTLKKNSIVAIVGKTGSGKTTLMDIICGLLKAKSGSILLNGKNINNNIINWQNKISYVPQNIYISDSSIVENIAIKEHYSEINFDKIKESAKVACCADFIEKTVNRYDTLIGNKGIRLSGGQAQRIGIARAIYQNSEILLLDEATSALDYETEKQVLDNLCKINTRKLVIIITHKISTLKYCDKIIEVNNKKIKLYNSFKKYYFK
jgi:ATP-binding cassette subfamily B protein